VAIREIEVLKAAFGLLWSRSYCHSLMYVVTLATVVRDWSEICFVDH